MFTGFNREVFGFSFSIHSYPSLLIAPQIQVLGIHSGEFEMFIPLGYGTIWEMSTEDFICLTPEDESAKPL
jgi:hypothetical protein